MMPEPAPPVAFHVLPLGSKPRILTSGSGSTPRHLPWTDYLCRPGWLLHVYNYSGQLVYDGRTYDFHDGWASLIPTHKGWREVWPASGSTHFYSRFSLRTGPGRQGYRFPVVWDLAERADRFRHRFLGVVSHRAEDPLWAEVGLWELLLELADTCVAPSPSENDRMPQGVRKALRFVETNLCEPVVAEDVAAASGLSYSYLALLFRRHLGMGVMAYVRARKVRLAEELLCHSEMPVKNIAAQIGLSDLQHFNKLVRQVYGVSPRALRRSAVAAG